MWKHLKNRQILDLKFRRQEPIGPYIVDFVCFESKLVIEVDGSQHNDQINKISDEARSKWLKTQGFTILRFWNNDIIGNMDSVLEKIYLSLKEKDEE